MKRRTRKAKERARRCDEPTGQSKYARKVKARKQGVISPNSPYKEEQ